MLAEIGMKTTEGAQGMATHMCRSLLGAVWREALWRSKTGSPQPKKLIGRDRFGFVLRWGQMGLFENLPRRGGESR